MSDEKPLVSIGMPVYNGEKYIRQALDSLLAQDYENFELIISDNASNDATQSICLEYAASEHRIRYFRNETNTGASANFKRVLDLANGPLFMWAAGDDIRSPECVSAFVAKLVEDSSVGLAFSNMVSVDSFGHVILCYQSFRRFDIEDDLERVRKFVSEPEIFGKACLIYGMFRTQVCREAWIASPPADDRWGSDMCFVLAAISRSKVRIDGRVLFRKRYMRELDAPTRLVPLQRRLSDEVLPSSNMIALARGYSHAVKGTPYYRLVLQIVTKRLYHSLMFEISSQFDKLRIRAQACLVRFLKSLYFGKHLSKIIRSTLPRLRQHMGTAYKTHDHMYSELMQLGIIKYDPHHKSYIRNVMGHRFHLNPDDMGLSRALAVNGFREPESVNALYAHLMPDMTVLDLGANIGFYVVLEAQIVSGGTGRVYAIEPTPESFRLLQLNVSVNQYHDRVHLFHGAISSQTGPVKLELYPTANSNRLTSIETTSDCLDTVEVPGFTLRDYLNRVGLQTEELDFLRMDIEGAEYDILWGMMDILTIKSSFLMFVEFHPHVNREKHIDVLSRLDSLGFRCLTATKEYPQGDTIARTHCPGTAIKQLYTDEFFLQRGGLETFLQKG